jgi:hypothetical protein
LWQPATRKSQPSPETRAFLDPERVDGVDAEQGAPVDRLRERPDRELQPGARVHPGHRDGARPRGERAGDRVDDLVRGHAREAAVERDTADARAGALRAQAECLVGREEVVRRGQDLVALGQLQPAVQEAEAHRGRVCERDLARRRTEIGRGRDAGRVLEARLIRVQVLGRARVEGLTVPLDRRPHAPRVRGEDEHAEVV